MVIVRNDKSKEVVNLKDLKLRCIVAVDNPSFQFNHLIEKKLELGKIYNVRKVTKTFDYNLNIFVYMIFLEEMENKMYLNGKELDIGYPIWRFQLETGKRLRTDILNHFINKLKLQNL